MVRNPGHDHDSRPPGTSRGEDSSLRAHHRILHDRLGSHPRRVHDPGSFQAGWCVLEQPREEKKETCVKPETLWGDRPAAVFATHLEISSAE